MTPPVPVFCIPFIALYAVQQGMDPVVIRMPLVRLGYFMGFMLAVVTNVMQGFQKLFSHKKIIYFKL